MRTIALAACLAAATAAGAQDAMPEGRDLSRQSFIDIDESEDSAVSTDELMAYGELVFVSQDTDEDGGISEQEFTSWGFGHAGIAEEQRQTQAYLTAQRIVFDIWDRDNDASISPEEQRYGLESSFAYADADGNGALAEDEYLDNFIVNIGLRNALTAE